MAEVRSRVTQNTLMGILLMCCAAALFGIMDGVVKSLSATYTTVQVIFARSFFAFIPVLLMTWRNGRGFADLRTTQLAGHAARSTYGAVAMVFFFYSYHVMPLADVTAIGFVAPIFIAVLSVWLLGEHVGIHRWSAIVVGFIGMLFIVRPVQVITGVAPESLYVVAGTLLYAMAAIQIRKLAATESSTAIAFYFSLFCSVYMGLALPWFWVTPSWDDIVPIVGVGILGGTAQLLMTRAFALAPVSIIAPFDYTHLIWSVLLGWYFWGDFPDLATWTGSAIVIASGLYIVYRETVVRKRGR